MDFCPLLIIIWAKKNCKNLSRKYCQKLLNHAKQSAADAFKTATKRKIQKKSEATGDLSSNKIANKITKISRASSQNNLGTVECETENIGFHREIP